MSAPRFEVQSLRKSGEVLRRAAEGLVQGERWIVPTECGHLRLQTAPSRLRLSAAPPPSDDPDLAQAMEVFWPGPLWLHLPSPSGKRCWYVPAHPLAQHLLKLVEQPLGGEPCGQDDSAEGLLLWKEPPLGLQPSEVDCARQPWGWLHTGWIERRAFEWVTGRPLILSASGAWAGPR